MNPELTAWIQVPITVKLPGQCIAAGPQPPALVLRKEAAHSPRTLAVEDCFMLETKKALKTALTKGGGGMGAGTERCLSG